MDSTKDELTAKIKASLSDPSKTAPVDPLTNEKIQNHQSDRELKKLYAKWFIWILIGQLIVMNAVFIGAGLKCLNFENYVLELYLTGTLAEVFGIVLVITKNLFPQLISSKKA